MAKTFAKPFYNSARWLKCRASFISVRQSVDGGLCQRCRAELGRIVHHKETLTPLNIEDPYVALNHDKLEYVCQSCHNRIDEDDRFCAFDEYGQVVFLGE